MAADTMIPEMPATPETSGPALSRRALLSVGAAAGGGLLMGVSLPSLARAATSGAPSFTPSAYLRVGRDGRATITVPFVEMGQGTYTVVPMLIAEELELPLDHVTVEHAPPDDKLYANPLLGFQVTGGSTTVRATFDMLRQVGAGARTQLIAAAAQQWKVDPADCRAEKAVVHGPKGQTLGYGALVDKAATLPAPGKVALKPAKDFTLIGTPAKRLDAAGKVDGSAKFGIDAQVPGLKLAAVMACPVPGGKLAHVDDSKAKAVKGVRQIVRLDNAVAVIADHTGAARKGLAALDVRWDEGAGATFSTAELVRQMAAAAQKPGIVDKHEGDVDAALKGAARRVDATYQLPLLAHATMEPMNCTVSLRPDGCDVWTSTQVITRVQASVMELTGLPADKVRIHNHLLGGGFGRRLEVDYVVQAVQIAKQVKHPIKLIWSREEDMGHDAYRPYYYDTLSAGLDASGKPVAWLHRTVGSSIVARWAPPLFKDGLDFDAVEGALGLYDVANVRAEYVRHELPAGWTTGWWRGVGTTHNAFVVEGFIDELAAIAGQDPVAYRRALLDKSPRARAVLDLATEKAGWGKPLPAGHGMGVSVVFGFGTYIAQVAEVSVGKDGKVTVHRVVCAVDCGQVVNPDIVTAQMQGGIVFGLSAALYGEITIKDGRVEQSNFDTYPVVRMDETPAIEVHLLPSTEAPGGIGEPGTATIAPAVINAIHAATGKRLRALPVDPKLLV